MENIKNYIFDFMRKYPFVFITNISLVIGGLFLFDYFENVGFFPSVNISDVFLLLLLSSLSGLIYIFLILATLISPVWKYHSCDKMIQFDRVLKEKGIHSSGNQSLGSKKSFFSKILNCYKVHPNKTVYNPRIYLLLFPIFVYIIISVPIVYFVFSKNYELNGAIGFIVLVITMFLLLCCIFYVHYKKIFRRFKIKQIFYSSVFYSYILQIYISLFFVSLSFLIAYPIMASNPIFHDPNFTNDLMRQGVLVISIIIFMLAFVFINIYQMDFIKRIGINLVILFSFLFTTGTIFIIPRMIISKFNLGQVKISALALNHDGCIIFSPNINDNSCIENNLTLIWKIGDTYVFDTIDEINSSKQNRYYIPKESVLSMKQVIVEKNK